jgi:O-antigen/teichoic acid export membrane protein
VPAALLVAAGTAALPVVVPALFGRAYIPMVLGTQIMLVMVAGRALFFWITPHYFASGRLKSYTLWFTLYITLTIILSWIVAPSWGFVGVSIVNVCCYALLLAVLLSTLEARPSQKPLVERRSP